MRDILAHLGEPTAHARGPPLWEATDAEHDPAADPLLQCVPDALTPTLTTNGS